MDVNTEWNVICRICLQDGELRSLFDRDEFDMSFSSKVMKCTSIEIYRHENLPLQICNMCVTDLDTAYRFRVNCESSDAILQTYKDTLIAESSISSGYEVSSAGILYSYKPPSGLDVKLVNKTETLILEDDADLYIYEEDESDLNDKDVECDSENDTLITFEDTIASMKTDDTEEPLIEDTTSLDNIDQNSNEFLYNEEMVYVDNDNEDDLLSTISGIKKESAWEEIDIYDTSNTGFEETEPTFLEQHIEQETVNKSPMKTIQTIRKSKNANEEKPTIETITTKTGPDGITETIIRVKRNLSTIKNMHACKLCGNLYKYRHALETHMRRHRGEKPFKCDQCDKAFVVQFELRRHVRTHTGQKPYACKYCERKFSDFGSKIKHERTHTGERPYVCNMCGKAFSYSHVLSSHMLTHTGVKRFGCEECGKRFTKGHHLKAHLNTHLKAASKASANNNRTVWTMQLTPLANNDGPL